MAAVRSLVAGGKTSGLMVTASHNPACDNGVKLVEPNGAMLPVDMEPWATQLATAETDDAVVSVLDEMMNALKVSRSSPSSSRVIIAHDTRDSSVRLAHAAASGVTAMGAEADMRGLLTTPQCHFITAAANLGLEETEEYYYRELAEGFAAAVQGCSSSSSSSCAAALIVDAANGVGGAKLRALAPLLTSAGLTVEVRNDGTQAEGVLNHLVGADFVQKEKVLPQNFSVETDVGKRCCSMDGDADRLVYFVPGSPCLQLFDGDRIAALAASYTRELIDRVPALQGLTMGIVQTAYANGASTAYLKQSGVDVVLTPTGVKWLHEAAHQFDVGVYFEANGHGTILFSPRATQAIEDEMMRNNNGNGKSSTTALTRLVAMKRMVNQTVGDALSVMLLCEAVLRCKSWSLDDWATMYEDLPSRQLKVKVQDRTVITTTNAETICVTPKGVQPAIDAVVAKYASGRAFVRPSGTEDVVRVYAEAESQDATEQLAREVAEIVRTMCGGI